MRRSHVAFIILLWTSVASYAQNLDGPAVVEESVIRFRHSFSFIPLPFIAAVGVGNWGIPLRYELGFPNSPFALSFFNSVLWHIDSAVVGNSLYEEMRIGPRLQLTGKNMNGLFTRLLGIVGFGHIPYHPDTDLTLRPTATFLYGAELDLGYTFILDIGFLVEAYFGVQYNQQFLYQVSDSGKFLPVIGLAVGWSI